jgi:PKD repeat protein
MKKKITLLFNLALVSAIGVKAQESRLQPCNTYAAMDAYFEKNPTARQEYEQQQVAFEKAYQQFLGNRSAYRSSSPAYTIPVVFHVLHQGGTENVSDALIIAAMNQINKDYSRTSADVGTIAQPFQNNFIDSEIRLMLAKRDPQGNCTTGIEHIYDSRTVWKQSDYNYYNGITWDRTKYLNVIIVAQIVPQTTVTGGGIIVGYTYKPGTSPSAAADAIVYNSSFLNGLDARSLSHEMGHWFNLDHTFGPTNNPGVACGDDAVSDTPPTKGAFSTCPGSQSGNSCATTGNSFYSAGMDNVENIMNYSSCAKNFTSGQTARMQTALNSPIAGRNNIWSANNLNVTGVNLSGACAPIADFMSFKNTAIICSGESLAMSDLSYNGSVSSWNWTADNSATTSSPNSANPTFVFPAPGLTHVQLSVSNNQGSSVKTKTILVIDATPGISSDFSEGFELPGTPAGWVVQNYTGFGWNQCNTGYDPASCFCIDGSQLGAQEQKILQSPVIDMSGFISTEFKFAISYAQQNPTQNDALKVEVSADCGQTWSSVRNLSASEMQDGTGGVTSDPYSPVIPEQWKVIDLTSNVVWNIVNSSNHLMIRFTFTEGSAGSGNNLFLDAINIGLKPTGLNRLQKETGMKIYPNPASGDANLEFSLNDAASVSVKVLNVLGAEVLPSATGNYTPGKSTIRLNTSSLQKGIYFVQLKINGAIISRELAVE